MMRNAILDGTLLSDEESIRYARHLSLPEVGEAGQRRLKGAGALIVGMGGLGCPAATYLAAAGIGRLGLIDPDRVTASNLQRQVLFGTKDIGRLKVEAARERLAALNPHVRVEIHPERLGVRTGSRLPEAYDLVIDCTDNLPTRFLINDLCLLHGKPWVHGAVHRFEGLVGVFGQPGGPCYRCLHPASPPATGGDCSDTGVLGVVTGVIGTLQAAEAIRVLLGLADAASGQILQADLLAMQFRALRLPRDPACPACGRRPVIAFPDEPHGEDDGCAFAWSVPTLRERMSGPEPPLVIDMRERHERAVGRMDGALWIPPDRLAACLRRVDGARTVVLFCQVGRRSAWAAAALREMGMANVVHLRGGFLAWRDPSLAEAVAR